MQIDRINNIYKEHIFGVCGSGFGFEINEVCQYHCWIHRRNKRFYSVYLFYVFNVYICSTFLFFKNIVKSKV